MTHPEFSKVASELRDEFIENDEDLSNGADINDGCCVEFAQTLLVAVRERLGGSVDCHLMNLGDLLDMSDADDEYGAPFDHKILEKKWPGIQPPDGLNWEDMNEMSAHTELGFDTHFWVIHDGRCYDAEAVEGVSSPFELPLLQRYIKGWQNERSGLSL